jgi:hypothetical protein
MSVSKYHPNCPSVTKTGAPYQIFSWFARVEGGKGLHVSLLTAKIESIRPHSSADRASPSGGEGADSISAGGTPVSLISIFLQLSSQHEELSNPRFQLRIYNLLFVQVIGNFLE